MTYTFERSGEDLVVHVVGPIDAQTAPELEQALNVEIDQVGSIVFDMQDVDYISSMGLRLLLALHKRLGKRGGTVSVSNAHDAVFDVLKDTGFTDILTMI